MKICRTTENISVSSDYSPDLPNLAKKISGKWDATNRLWVYPIGAEPQVKELYLNIYGTWDDVQVDTVTLVCTATDGAADRGSLTLGGRIIATAFSRDGGARTRTGVVVVNGGFTSGGSMKNWLTKVSNNGVTFRLLDVPRLKAEMLLKNNEWCDNIIIETAEGDNRTNLETEKAKLLARISEIDALLNKNN